MLVAGSFMVFVHGAVARDRYDDGKSVAVQTDGKIVVAGYATVGPAAQIALVRYNVDGSLDKSFNGTGKVITAVGDGDCKGEGLALQTDGKIVVAGYSFKPGGKDRAEFTVLRYNPDGTLDSGFGESGKVTSEIGRDADDATSVALQSDGKIVAAGRTFAPPTMISRSRVITQMEVSIRPSTGPVKQPPTLVSSTTAAVSLCRAKGKLSSPVTQSTVTAELLQSRASTRMGRRTSALIKPAK